MGTASRPGSAGIQEIESADDFNPTTAVSINQATFTGLLPAGLPLSDVNQVIVEIYRVFPNDSVNPPDNNVPTRMNSPSDNAFLTRDSAAATLSFTTTVLSQSFTVANTVVNGIFPKPGFTTGGEGPMTGQEVRFNLQFSSPLELGANHYFFVPQVRLSSGNFLWLSTPRPIVAPGTPFTPDLQTWIRNASLEPDWLRVGTDIVGGAVPPTFNAAFSLSGMVPDAGYTAGLLALSICLLVSCAHRETPKKATVLHSSYRKRSFRHLTDKLVRSGD